jgi:signal transduction histidine kinase/DNA-binding response OmpR family regulator/streptogramin lyase
VEDGLSQNEVTSIAQDNYGFMWFGTRGGLNRYDGYAFKQYKPSANNKNTISNPSVEYLYYDPDNNGLWIGLKSGGAVKYDLSGNEFQEIQTKELTRDDRITSCFKDHEGNTWLGSWSNGLFCLLDSTVNHYEVGGQVKKIVQTADGSIWVASSSGLKCKKPEESHFETVINNGITSIAVDNESSVLWVVGWTTDLIRINYRTFEKKVFPFLTQQNRKLYSLLRDSKGYIWVGTWGHGLYRFDEEKEILKRLHLEPELRMSSSSDYNVIRVMYEDKVGDVWVGTQAGIVRLSPGNNFSYTDLFDNGNLRKPHVNAILIEESGEHWMGTNGNGLYYSLDYNEEFRLVKMGGINQSSNEDLIVKSIHKDNASNIWVSYEEGLFIVNKNTSSTPSLVRADVFFNSPDLRRIRKAHQVLFEKDEVWIATQQNGAFLFRNQGGRYYLLKHFIAGNGWGQLGDIRVTAIKKDWNGHLWLATYKGLYQFQETDSSFIGLNDLGVNAPLVCDIVLCLEPDKEGNLWLGTPCSLNKLQLQEGNSPVLQSFTKASGLSDDYINSIEEGNDGLIWFSTNAGISSLNPKNSQVINFDKVDGLGDASYSEGASFKDKDGTLYFGGYTSLTFFNPDKVRVSNYHPPIVISELSILNKEVNVDGDFITRDVNEIALLELSHREMAFSFKVAAIDYKAPGKNQYAFRLLGQDTLWVKTGTNRDVSFNNLKPGDYQLQIKATNSNGIWSNQIKTIGITVFPAPWKSTYAIIGYVLFILLVVFMIIRTVIRQERLQSAVEMERIRNNQIKEINDYKLRFFTNISHEFRTPLTLILAPVKELMNKDFTEITPTFFKDRINSIGHNTKRLYNLVNQLLEFRKMESGKITLNVSKCNLQKLVDENCIPFNQLAMSQTVQFITNYKAKETTVFVDSERLSVVLTNLLSNAFKHVKSKGRVKVDVSDDAEYYRIDISNEGQTIPTAELKHLFERFYQVKGNSSLGSSGIGLQLVKAFTELHKGRVQVSSEEGEPVVFSVYLKKGNDHFSADELVTSSRQAVMNVEPEIPVSKPFVNTGTKGATVLIVEDNAELREYLVKFVGQYYDVIPAVDGYDGFEKAMQFKPALVLSDVMMPRMDGYELCEKIKLNDVLSDIPVVLLTAKGSDSDQLFGARKGVDLYIKKPFVPDLLLEEIKQLIASRKRLKEKYARKVILEVEKEEISSEEAVFLKQALKIIEQHLKQSHFTPEVLAKELAMSSSSFYRRIKKTTNLTPAGFIKSIRLKKAAQLLKNSDLSVSEIIERVGYLDARSFRKNFKEQFGDTPTDYRNNME